MWLSIAEKLSKENRAIYLIDLPCHGESRFDGEICSMHEVAALIAAFLDELNLIHPLVFGHSMGGYIGLELLRLKPIQLTLVHSNFWADPIAKKKDRNRVIEIVKTNKMRLIHEAIPNLFAPKNRVSCKLSIEGLIEQASKIPANEIIACTRGMRDRLDLSTVVKNQQIDIIQGDEDPIISTTELMTAIQKVNGNTIVHHIKSCGHMSVWENPEALINHIRRIVFR